MTDPDSAEEIARLRRALEESRALEQQARASGELALRARDAFLSKLSHDLRNPMGAIAAATEVLSRIGGQTPDEQRARDVIRRQIQNLTRIVDELLDTSRVLNGSVVLTRMPLDLATAVQRAVDGLAAAGRFEERRLELDLAPGWIHADSARVDQVVAHLLANALKFSQPGAQISIHVAPADDTVLLAVADTGIGIAPARLDRVFDPFVRPEHDKSGRRGGFGASLALVKRLIEEHGGSVRATSDGEGRGSRFEVRLPRMDPPRRT